MPLPLHLHTAAESRSSSTVPSPSQSSHHHSRMASRLRNLFTPNRSATFAVTVTIHSVQNVPQVQGYFSVGWKFRDGEGGGRAKVDVKPADVMNDLPANLPDKPPLPIPRNLVTERRSLDTTDSRESSAASSTTTIDDLGGGLVSPISAGSVSSMSTTGMLSPIGAPGSHGTPAAPSESKKKFTGSAGARAALPAMTSSLPGSAPTSMSSSRQTSKTSAEGLGALQDISTTANHPEDLGESSRYSVHSSDYGIEYDPAFTPGPQPDRLTVPIQHSRSTRRQASSMHKASSSSLRSNAHSIEKETSPSHAALPLLVDSISVPVNTVSERRGCTPIAQLHNHSCEWGCTVTQLVRMKVHSLSGHHHARTTQPPLPDTPPLGILGAGSDSESGLKLTVWQHIRPPTIEETRTVERGSMKHRANGRGDDSYEFGGMNLDLAEFVGEEIRRAGTAAAVGPTVVPGVGPSVGMGGVTRRYLLTERAKTNATLKLTIDIKQVAGETNYVAPILQKRHIVSALADFGDEEPIVDSHHQLTGLHLTHSNASSNSGMSALSTKSRTSSLSNLRLTSTTTNSTTCSLAPERMPCSPMTRLKQLPEQHLLKPLSETTKSSSVKRKTEAGTSTKGTHLKQADSPEGIDPHGREERNGNLDSSDTTKPHHGKTGLTASPSDSTAHLQPESSHHRRHSRKSHSARLRRHQHHPHHTADPETTPECIVEAVFNPKPSNVYTPFTYVVAPGGRSVRGTDGKQPKSPVLPEDKLRSHDKVADHMDVSLISANTTMTSTTNPAESADEGSDTSAVDLKVNWIETESLQPHAREQARWNAAQGVWERRRGRGYGKMRTMPRRAVNDIERPFFKRLGRSEDGAANQSSGIHQPVHA
ncbi:hypothetical protein NliqN6_4376 [Naganishia liquefaciens]|uniref:C2 NT-type domain-containing protein n=1 Tax=Naganishia liquefaciens TaxID=104408 RepID=A0A8H3TVS2_9TREE|nr:hypothetical protein NliqN6_4376 [Naganishia liquefaciens]